MLINRQLIIISSTIVVRLMMEELTVIGMAMTSNLRRISLPPDIFPPPTAPSIAYSSSWKRSFEMNRNSIPNAVPMVSPAMAQAACTSSP